MQGDFKRFLPDLFRGDEQVLTTNASGYIFLPVNAFEVEQLVFTSTKDPLDPMSKTLKYRGTGWYHDGMQTTSTGAGKKRIMVRNAGAAYASLSVTVDILIEYPSLSDLDGIPYPFVQQRYLNMLAEMQAFMLHMEGGKESTGEASKHWNAYQFLLGQAKKDALDKLPQFMAITHSDAGDGNALPMVR